MAFPSTVDSIVDNTTTLHASQVLGPQRITVGPVWFNVKSDQFGAVGNGVADDTNAIQAAINAAIVSGGSVVFPNGKYLCTGQLNLDNSIGVKLIGDRNLPSGGSPNVYVQYTGTAASFISARSTNAFGMSGLYVQYTNNGFAGSLVDTSHGSLASDSSFALFRNCQFTSASSITTAAAILSLDKTIDSLIDNCVFHGAQVGIRGLAAGGSYSNRNSVTNCGFSSSVGDIAAAHISNLGQGWLIAANTFEMGQAGGNAVVVANPAPGPSVGVSFIGNWVGDQGANAVTQITSGSGWQISGNYLAGNANSICISVPNNAAGINISGNQFDTHSVAVAIGTTVNRFLYGGNSLSGVSSEFTGTPNSGGQVFISGTQTLYGAAQVQGDLGTTRGIGPGTPAVALQSGRLYMGSGVPSNANGNNGDFYFRTDTPGTANQRLYTKSAGAWTGIL